VNDVACFTAKTPVTEMKQSRADGADLLAAGPRTAAALAEAVQADEAALYRVLRLLAALGVLTEPEPPRRRRHL
jgi:hypothetical protein